MADFDRGVKASLVAATIYLAISVILSAIYQNDPLSLPYFVLGTGLTPLFLLKELADPSFVLSLLFQYMIRGLIFGAVFAALYSLIPGGASPKKGVILSAFLWIVGAVWLIYVTPGWPDDGAVTLIVVGLTVSLSSISLALVSVVSALVFGALTGFLWDGFRGKEWREERKGRSVLRFSFILGVVYWALLAVGWLVGVATSGEILPVASDAWWGDILSMLVVFLGLPGWILARAAWKKTKADKSGFKWGVGGGVMMMLTGIMLFPGVLAIIGGVVSRRKAVSEPSSTANVGRLNRYMPRVGIFLIGVVFLIAVALIGGTVGSGPPAQDLEIRTWHDLDAVRDNLDGHHILMNHLDATTAGYIDLASPTANQGKGWRPIGAFSTQQTNADHGLLVFEGTFDGQGYEIRDLFINRPDEGFVGLFLGVEEKGVVKQIGLVNATVTGSAFVGSLVGWNRGAVRDSYFTGNMTGDGFVVGGLVGGNFGSVSDSCSTGSVTGNSSIGGLVGQNYGTVSNSYSSANVVGTSGIGGVVGTSAGTVSQSYSTGSVSGNLSVGGVMGSNVGTVGDSYSTGSVTGNSSVGGLIGDTFDGTVSDSYSTASVTGNYTVGGLVGENVRTTVSNSFWDTETSGQATSAGGMGKTTAEMQDIDTFSGAGWNIIAVALGETNSTCIWNIVNDVTCPFLS